MEGKIEEVVRFFQVEEHTKIRDIQTLVARFNQVNGLDLISLFDLPNNVREALGEGGGRNKLSVR